MVIKVRYQNEALYSSHNQQAIINLKNSIRRDIKKMEEQRRKTCSWLLILVMTFGFFTLSNVNVSNAGNMISVTENMANNSGTLTRERVQDVKASPVPGT